MNGGEGMTKKRLILLVTIILVVLFVTFFLVARDKSAPTNMIFISGVSNCSKNIDPVVIENMGDTLYAYVATANDFNKTPGRPTYQAEVRKDSCRQEETHTVKADSGHELVIKTSSVIVDIPEAKQSWRVKYDWAKKGDGLKVDLGMPTPTCLASTEVRYGGFNCGKALNIYKYGTPEYDPIQKYMPYSGAGFGLDYSPSDRQVIVSLDIPTKQKDNQELIENSKAVIPYWFQKRKLDINKYTVVYRVVYE